MQLCPRLDWLEKTQQRQALVAIRLRIKDAENRSRRNNVRLHDIPETIPNFGLYATVSAILNQVLERSSDEPFELERVHGVAGPRNPSATHQRDVLRKVHYHRIKEDSLQKAWQMGQGEYNGAYITLLSNLSRATLSLRRGLKPILGLIRAQWGAIQLGTSI